MAACHLNMVIFFFAKKLCCHTETTFTEKPNIEKSLYLSSA